MNRNCLLVSLLCIAGCSTAAYAQDDGAGIEFSWTGNDVASVAVNPSEGGTITVSNNVSYDNQVVYLYHPKTKKFLYNEGRWGTMAVVKYEGFGMPLNIVLAGDPAVQYNGLTTYGIYTASDVMGKYLGKDYGRIWGQDSYQMGELYVDRGGGTGAGVYGTYQVAADMLETTGVLRWVFEPVEGLGEQHVYNLAVYLYNGRNTANGPFKHYIKVNDLEIGGVTDQILTSTKCVTDPDNIGAADGDEEKPAASDADYYWQIVTRKDIKDRFVSDNEDPYGVEWITGNANYLIDNPDFSRGFREAGAFKWTQSVSGIYAYTRKDKVIMGDDGGDIGEGPYGKYYLLQPQKSGTISQTFTPNVPGIYRLDVQGINFGNNTSEVKLETEDDGIFISKSAAFDKIADWNDLINWNDVNASTYENITGFPSEDAFNNRAVGSGGDQEPRDWSQIYNDETTGVPVNTQITGTGIRRVYCLDRYGRSAVGVYVVTTGDVLTSLPEGNGYHYNIDGTDWQNGGVNGTVITAKLGSTINFGPSPNEAENTYDMQWFGPNGWTATGRGVSKVLGPTDSGDYICVYKQKGTENYGAFYYRVELEDLPTSSNVKPYASINGWDNPDTPYNIVKVENAETNYELGPQQINQGNQTITNEEFNTAVKDIVDPLREPELWVEINRAVSLQFYNNPEKYVKSVYVYVPTGHTNEPITINLNLTVEPDANCYEHYSALDNVRLTYIGDVPFVLKDYAENVDYINEASSTNIPVYMRRKFDTDAWNAFVTPVSLTKGNLTAAFGNGVKVSEISTKGLDPSNPYVIVFNKINLETMADNAVAVLPGHFYLVNPEEVNYEESALQLDLTNTESPLYTLDMNDSNPYFVKLGRHNMDAVSYADAEFKTTRYTSGQQGVDHNSIELIGSYAKTKIPAAYRGDSYVFATKTGETVLVHLNETGDDFPLGAFRFYIHDVEEVADGSGAKNLSFIWDGIQDEDEVITLAEIIGYADADNSDIYTIAGQKVTGKLPKGAYVKNGKKFLVK